MASVAALTMLKRVLVVSLAILFLLPLGHATDGNFTSPPWVFNAHSSGGCPGGTNCPTIVNGNLNTTMIDTQTCNYCSGEPFNSNVYQGNMDWCNCIPSTLSYTVYSIVGTFNRLSYSSSTHDYTLETSFHFYMPTAVNGTQVCNNQVVHITNAHWMDIEIFYSGRTGTQYIGCSGTSPANINWRQVINQTLPGQNFHLSGFDIIGSYQNALYYQGLPSTTVGYLSGVEIGVEGFGLSDLSVIWYDYGLG